MERLVAVVQELSLARDLEAIMTIVRRAARELTGADGATFILRDGDCCYYADEDAIAPLWKGQRFPMSLCISGWVMLNRQHTIIEDIYVDPRIPIDAYRPTFVKSLAMVPIRTLDPIGAIGNYWAKPCRPTAEQIKVLQALADTTAVALENVRIYGELEQRVKDRTAALEAANKELEAFSYAVSHDLRAPLRAIDGFTKAFMDDYGATLAEQGRRHLERVCSASKRMAQLIEDLLFLSRTAQSQVRRDTVNVSKVAQEVIVDLRARDAARSVDVVVAENVLAHADPRLLRIVMENLLSNAWKFTSKQEHPRIEVGTLSTENGEAAYYVRDNGAGFDMAYAQTLFGVFQRLHSQSDYPGTGVGLATVRRIIAKHGGRIWGESEAGRGATFTFTLPPVQ
jgi:signal transduction histidine kinase